MRPFRVAAAISRSFAASTSFAAARKAAAALRSAALNVYINAKMISDESFVEAKLSELKSLLDGAEAATEKAYDIVKGKVS